MIRTLSPSLVDKTNHVAKIAYEEKPHVRVARLGPEALSDSELLSMFLRGRLPNGEGPIDLAKNLLHAFGSISEIGSLSVNQLANEYGMTLSKAAKILALFEVAARCSKEKMQRKPMSSADTIYESVRARLAYKSQEHVLIIMLDTKLQATRTAELSKGNVNTALCEPRDVLHEVLIHKAPSFVLVHNHPSGDPSPSREDTKLTKLIQQSCETMRIRLVDHIIIGRPSESHVKGYYSFTEDGVI